MDILLIVAMLICVVWTSVSAVLLSRFLEQRGYPISFIWFRALILKYLSQYRQITLEETGHVGPLFYHYVVPLCIVLVLVVILVVSNIR